MVAAIVNPKLFKKRTIKANYRKQSSFLCMKLSVKNPRIVDVKFYPIIITASYGVTSMDKIFSPGALHKIARIEVRNYH